MGTLEDTLGSFGATADFWLTAADADKDAEHAEAWEEVKCLVVGLPDEEARALLNRIVQDTLKSKPTYLSLADIHSERGDVKAASKAREKAYEAILKEHADAEDLCRIGYLLLERCAVDELPLREEDFGEGLVDFGDNDTLFLSSHPYYPKVPQFPDKADALAVAIRAFGLAWLYYYEHCETPLRKSDAWRALLPLDGLRAAFQQTDNLEPLQAAIATFWEWVEWYDLACVCDEFAAKFTAAAGYLAGRAKAAPLPFSEEKLRRVVRSELERVQGRLDLIVEKLIDLDQRSEMTWEQVREWAKKSPEGEKAKIRDDLEATLGHVWSKLEPGSQEDLIDAKVVSAECSRVESAWRCAAIGYCTAVERELKKTIEYLTGKILAVPSGEDETFGWLIKQLTGPMTWARKDKGLSEAARLLLDGGYTKRLWELNAIRKRTAHPHEVIEQDVLRMQELLLRPANKAQPLLAVIVQARGAS